MSIFHEFVLLIILRTPLEYFFSSLLRISFNMIGFTSVNMINSCRSRYRPAMKSAASTFSSDSFSFVSNSFSISWAVNSVIRGASLGIGDWVFGLLVSCPRSGKCRSLRGQRLRRPRRRIDHRMDLLNAPGSAPSQARPVPKVPHETHTSSHDPRRQNVGNAPVHDWQRRQSFDGH